LRTNNLLVGVAFAALLIPGAAFAQSTGTIEFEKDVVVTGAKSGDLAGTIIPDSPKTKVGLTNAFLSHETAGQSVLESINNLPGVSFTNNDPYGSSGGTLTVRGFDASRIALTLDGVPLNDTGNYAIYSSQQLDPELIDQVNVILGSTDIDSPTASASGSTINYTSVTPTDQFGARVSGSVGDLNMMRIFGMVNTGVFTPWGTKAWFSASNQNYNVVYASQGKIKKDQYNFKVYQPFGNDGDFISVAGSYNSSRNNNTPDFYIDSAPRTKAGRDYTVARCQTDVPQAGVADTPNACGTDYTASYNPSNTATLRVASSFHLAPNLVLSVDPTYWYTKANGGSSAVTAYEGTGAGGLTGYVVGANGSAGYYFGRDLNGDGDTLDTPACTVFNANGSCKTYSANGVKLYAPSHTQTNRILVLNSLLWTPSTDQTLRLSYTYDHARHRQTGELSTLQADGFSTAYFPIDDPLLAANGTVLEKRNRKSYVDLNEVSGEYRGKFLNERLTINLGVSGKFFRRDLTNYCFTTTATGGVNCVAGDASANAAYAALHPYSYNATTSAVTGYATPQTRDFSYNRVLPSAGLTYKFDNGIAIYGSYSEGIQVPGTDNLYASFFSPAGVQNAKPEITQNFDAGVRFRSSKVQLQAGPWYTIFTNRLASSYDPIQDITIYRNLGTVHKYGFDGSVTYRPVQQLSLYAFGSYLKSKILNNVVTGECTAANVTAGASAGVGTCTSAGQSIYGLTAGKRESGAPTYTLGGRAQIDLRPVTLGGEIKRTGASYLNDQNLVLIYNGVNYGKVTKGYTVVNLDARVTMGWAGLNDKTFLQLNVTNLFDVLYINHASSGIAATNDPFVYISPPRTVSATLNVQF
jgi:iron complex outermembrane receptor protein